MTKPKNLVDPFKPIYDEVYFKGVEWLNSGRSEMTNRERVVEILAELADWPAEDLSRLAPVIGLLFNRRKHGLSYIIISWDFYWLYIGTVEVVD